MTLDSIIQWFAGIGTGRVALFAASFALVGMIAPSLVEPYRIEVVQDTIRSAALPAGFDGARVVFISDIHAGPYFSEGRMADLIDRVNALDPDILVLGGDYVGGRLNGARIFYPAVGEMRANLGRFAVIGNHDAWEDEAGARSGLADAGFTVLDNESVLIGDGADSIRIAGLEDVDTGSPDVTEASGEIAAGEFSFLVAHNPEAFDGALTPGVFSFALAGHTHGGQINVLNSIAPMVRPASVGRHLNGWRDYDGTPVLVSNGVGTVTVPVRSGAVPQIHVITLRAQ